MALAVLALQATNGTGQGSTRTIFPAGTTATTATFDVPAGALLVACTMGSSNSQTNPTVAITNNGTALTWTQVGLANDTTAGGTEHGVAAIHVARAASAVSGLTVTSTQTNGSNPTGLKVYVITGVDTTTPFVHATIGHNNTNNTTTTAFTSTYAGSLLVAAFSDWSGTGTTPTSSDLTLQTGDAWFDATNMEGISGYKSLPTAGTSATANAGLTGTNAWKYVTVEIVPVQGPTTLSGSATLSADSTLTATGTPIHFAGASLSADSTLTGSGLRIGQAAASFAADTVLKENVILATGTLTATSTLTAGATAVYGKTATLAASSTLSANGLANRAATATFSAGATLSATGKVNILTANIRLFGSVTGKKTVSPKLNATALRLFGAMGSPTTTRGGAVGPANIRLGASVIGIRLGHAVSAPLTAKALVTVPYELVCYARIPQQTGKPLFIAVDPINWTGLSYVDALSTAQSMQFGCKIAELTEPVLQRLRNPAELATEMWLYRRGKLVFAGPMLSWQVQGESLTVNSQGLMAYLKMMVVNSDLVFANTDQFTIVKGLVDQWQALDYGNFGLDTSGITTSGYTRDATYLQKELHNVGQRVLEMGARQNGFEISIDPTTRKIQLDYPQRGVNRSVGEDAIVFDQRNVTSPNIVCSIAAGDVASEGFGTGTLNGVTIYSTKSNLELRSRYGRTGTTAAFDGVGEQPTLDGYTQGLVDARSAALLVPGPDARVTPDADLSSYDVGDTVAYTLHSTLSVSGAFRIRKRSVTVKKTGQETVSVQFV